MYTYIHVCIEFRKFHYDDQPRIAKSAWVLLYLICRTDYLQCHTNNPCLERSGSRTFCGAGRLRKKLTPKSTDPWVVLAKKKVLFFSRCQLSDQQKNWGEVAVSNFDTRFMVMIGLHNRDLFVLPTTKKIAIDLIYSEKVRWIHAYPKGVFIIYSIYSKRDDSINGHKSYILKRWCMDIYGDIYELWPSYVSRKSLS